MNSLTGTAKFHDGSVLVGANAQSVGVFDVDSVRELAGECKAHRAKEGDRYIDSEDFITPTGNNWDCTLCTVFDKCHCIKRNEAMRH